MRREKEFRQQCCRNSTKIGERKRKREREKAEEFRQYCYRNSYAQNTARSVKKKAIAATPLPKKKKKKFVLAIVAMPLLKMKKKIMKSVNEKKKMLSRTQYFYNIFTINHTWLIIISSKNLWQINCGNDIAENGKKNYEICEWVKKKVVTYTIFLQYFHNKSHVINYY